MTASTWTMTTETRNLWTAWKAARAGAERAGLRCLEFLSLDAQGVDDCAELAVRYARLAGREALTAEMLRPALVARLTGRTS